MWDDAKQLNALAATLALVATVMLAAGVTAWLIRQPAFAFRDVVVRGNLAHVNPAHLEAVIRDELSGTFFTMNLERARASLVRVPWVRRVALRRLWPQRLEVTIDEHVPLARWNEQALVDVDGDVFAADYDGELPQFEGDGARSHDVVARYREWSEELAQLSYTVERLRLSPRGGWTVTARNDAGPLTMELGHDDAQARLEHFVGAYQRTLGVLARNGMRIEHVDLRYRNGFTARVPGFRERAPRKAGTNAAAAPRNRGQ
jgi:cell division protein FtsQ